MARIKTYSNPISLLPGELNQMQDDYELGFGGWKPVAERVLGGATFSATIGSYIMHMVGNGNGGLVNTTNAPWSSAFRFDPAFYLTTGRSLKLRLRTVAIVNATASGALASTVRVRTAGLGAVSSQAVVASAGSVMGGVTLNGTLAANSITTQLSPAWDSSAMVAGNYAVVWDVTVASTAGCFIYLLARLEARQV